MDKTQAFFFGWWAGNQAREGKGWAGGGARVQQIDQKDKPQVVKKNLMPDPCEAPWASAREPWREGKGRRVGDVG